jgi:hypothetical protein
MEVKYEEIMKNTMQERKGSCKEDKTPEGKSLTFI